MNPRKTQLLKAMGVQLWQQHGGEALNRSEPQLNPIIFRHQQQHDNIEWLQTLTQPITPSAKTDTNGALINSTQVSAPDLANGDSANSTLLAVNTTAFNCLGATDDTGGVIANVVIDNPLEGIAEHAESNSALDVLPNPLHTSQTPAQVQLSKSTPTLQATQASKPVPAETSQIKPKKQQFACCLFVVMHNPSGVALVADIARPKATEAERRLLLNLLRKMGINIGANAASSYTLFNWPISKAFCDKTSAAVALEGLLSNWQPNSRRFLVCMGEIGFNLLMHMVQADGMAQADIKPASVVQDYAAGSCINWGSANIPLISSFSASQLLADSSLRHQTWQHTAPVRSALQAAANITSP